MSGQDLNATLNPLRANSFKIAIDRKNYPTMEFLAQNVIHPGVQLPSPTFAGRRIQNIGVPGEALGYDELTITVLVDEELRTYKEVYDWFLRNVNEEHSTPEDEIKTGDPASETDIIVTVLDTNNRETATFQYKNCSPTNVGPLNFTAQSTTAEPITFDVSFSLTGFELRT